MTDIAVPESLLRGIPALAPLDAHNERLLENVHPPAWVNLEPASRYNLVVLGAGPIGCEMAQSFALLGSRVVLLEKLSGVLPREDPEAAAIVAHALRRDGVEVRCAAEVKEVRLDVGGEKRLVVECDGKTQLIAADAILVAVGRTPNVEGLNLRSWRATRGT